MSDVNGPMDRLEELRARLDELVLIRQGFACHLGESLYEVARDTPELRAGREQLLDGMALCDSEAERTKALIDALATEQARTTPSTCPACGSVVEPSHKFCMNCGHKLG